VYVSLGVPSPVSAKLWFTKEGRAILASNAPAFSCKDVWQLSYVITANFDRICEQGKQRFGEEPVFYDA